MGEEASAASEEPQTSLGDRHWRDATRALFAAALVAIVLLHGGFGISWDETVQTRYGEHVLDYFLSGGADRGFEQYYNLRYYGALFELASAAFHRALGADPYAHRSLLTALVALLTVGAASSLGRLLGGNRVGFLSALALLMMPRFVGHGFFNSKDIPFACGVAWSFYLMARMQVTGSSRYRDVLALAGACGGAMAIRSIAIGLLGFVGAMLCCGVAMRRTEPARSLIATWLPRLGLLTFVSWALMVAFWPFAHDAPLSNPLLALSAGHGSGAVIKVRYLGSVYPSTGLPGHYLTWSLLIVTPPLVTAFALLGAAHLAAGLTRARAWAADEAASSLVRALLLAWAFGPLLVGAVLVPNVYDGIRHIVFVLPGFAVLAALGADWILRLRGPSVAAVPLSAAVLLALFAVTIWGTLAAGRYPIAYFNFMAGPSKSVHVRYDTDYWVTSYREAAEWINGRQAESDRPLEVVVAADHYNREAFAHFAHEDVVLHTTRSPGQGALPPEYDYYVATTRYGWVRGYAQSPVVREIRSGGVLLSVIRGPSRPDDH